MSAYSFLILLLGILPTAFLFLLARAERDFGTVHPIRATAWMLFFGYTLKSTYLAYAVVTGAPFRTDHLPHDIIPIGQGAIILGTISFAIGYIACRQNTYLVDRLLPKKYSFLINPKIYYYPIFIISLSLMIIYFYKMDFLTQIVTLKFKASKWFIQEETDAKSSLGFLTMGAHWIMVYYLYNLIFQKKPTYLNIYFVAIIFISVCFFLASKRNGVIIIVILFLMMGNFRNIRSRISNNLKNTKKWVLILSIMLVLAFASQIRKGGGEKSISDLELTSAITISMEHALQGAYFLDPAKTAAIISHVSTNDGYLLGQSFINFIFTPVPRILWPEKPNIRIGPYVGQEILGFNNESGAPPGGVGELYLNFGWPGVVIGMALLGAIVGRLWRRYIAASDRRFRRVSLALYMAVLMLFLLAEFSAAIVLLIKFQIGIAVCERYWRWRLEREA